MHMSLFKYIGLFWDTYVSFDMYRSESLTCENIHAYVTGPTHMWYDSFIRAVTHSYVMWLLHMWHAPSICDSTRSYGTHWHVTWYTPRHASTHMWCDSCICHMPPPYVTWLTHTGRTYMWRDARLDVPRHTHMCYDLSYVTYLIHMWHDLLIRAVMHLHMT